MKRKWWKALLGSVFVLCLVLVGNMSTDAAAGTVEKLSSGVVRQAYTEISSYREEGNFKAPSAPEDYSEYVFAGWYTDAALTKALDSAATSTSDAITNTSTTYYAKFVPKEILGVRVQVSASTTYATDKTNVRFITTVDSAYYSAVGFDVELNGTLYNGQSSKVYKKLFVMNSKNEILEDYLPQNVFHEMSKYFLACKLSNVVHADYGDLMKVTPYWITLDGTTVQGDTVNKTVNEAYTPSTASVTATQIATLSRDTESDTTSCYTQGACTDGTYFYQAFVRQADGAEVNNDTDDRVYIAKYEMSGEETSKEPVLQSGSLDLHHANDITFNKDLSYTGDATKSGLLVICHNSPYRDRVSFVDPDTLEFVNPNNITDVNGTAISWGEWVLAKEATYIQLGKQTITYEWTWNGWLPERVEVVTTESLKLFSMEYNAAHQQYVVGIAGGGQTYRILDASFNDVYDKAFDPIDTDITAFTTQGVAADDKYIYFVFYNPTTDGSNITYNNHTGHVIAVYDWQGNPVRVINVATENGIPVTKEPENISIYNNVFYIGVGGTDSLNLYQLNKDGWVSENQGDEAYIGSPDDDEYYKTLEAAVEAADDGDTITIIAKNVDVSALMEIASGKDVTITNEAGVNVTIKRSADYNGSLIANSGTLTIKSNTTGSLTFDGGTYRGNTYISNTTSGTLNLENITMANILANTDGGAVHSSGTLKIDGSTFKNIKNYYNGAAVYVADGIANINKATFDGNVTDRRAGAIYVADAAEVESLTGSVLKNNSSGTSGGAILNAGTLKVSETEFTGNNAGSVAGAINCEQGILQADSCKFISNTAATGAGAVQVANGSEATFTSADKTGSFEKNVAGQWNITTDENGTVVKTVEKDGVGGAIRVNNSNLTVNGYTFDNNSATSTGGAVYIGKDVVSLDAADVKAVVFENTIFTLNETAAQGGAIYNTGRELKVETCEFGGTDTQTDTDGNTQDVLLGNIASGNTDAEGNVAPGHGGAIYHALGKLTVNGSEFIGNSAAAEGGAIMLPYASITATVTNSVFEQNEATTNGGAICNRAYTSADTEDINLAITDCRFGRVETSTDETTGESATVSYGNIAELNGGAIYNGNNSVLELVGSSNSEVSPLFAGNEAKGTDAGGGAICVGTGTLSVDGYQFDANKASGGQGGAIRTGGSTSSTITKSEFTLNTSAKSGGAIFKNDYMSIVNSVFEENSAGSVAGAINSEAENIDIQNTNFRFNKSGANSSSNAGAIQVNGGTATIEVTDDKDYTFYKNEATGKQGGAISVINGAKLIMQKAENAEGTITFDENAAAYGGAISVNRGTVDVTGIAFESNTATNGGAIYVDGGSLTVKNDDETSTTTKHAGVLTASDCTFEGNEASGDGGAIYLSNYAADATETTEAAGTTAKLNKSTFIKNATTGGNGGAVYAASVITAKDTYGLTVEDCTFGAEGDTEYASANTATANGKYGGAIYITTGNAQIVDTKFLYNSACNGGGVGAQSANIIEIISDDKTENALFEGNKATYVKSGGQGGAIRFWKTAEGTSVSGYTFESNTATGNGGAVQADQSTSLSVSKCVFNSNSTSADGGALQTWSSIAVAGSEFYKNSANNGGAISFGRLSKSSTVKDCTFGGTDTETGDLGNTATVSGGAIYSAAQSLALSDDKELSVENVFIGNKATSTEEGATPNGGAICVVEGVTSVTEYEFKNNEATNGGAIYVSGYTASEVDYAGTFEATTCEFTENKASISGGAVYLDSSAAGTSATLSEATFTKNSTSGNGGAISNASVKTYDDAEQAALTITNCTIGGSNVGNKASGNGGAIYSETSKVKLVGDSTLAILEENKASGNGGAVYIYSGELQADGYKFKANNANSLGGAIRLVNQTITAKISNSEFISNTANNGGAIHNSSQCADGVEYSLIIENTIFGGEGLGNSANVDGGAIYNANGSAMKLVGAVASHYFQENKALTGQGGAIRVGTGNLYIDGYTFKSNQAVESDGGAIQVNSNNSEVIVKNSNFTENKVASGKNGGAIYSKSKLLDIDDTSFTNHTTATLGGAIYHENADSNKTGGTVSLDSTTSSSIANNTASENGGAIYMKHGLLETSGYTFSNNNAENGGAVYLGEMLTEASTDEEGNAVAATYSSGNLTATGTTFTENEANYGGAIYALAGTVSIEGNSLFEKNKATTQQAGALYVADNAIVTKLDDSTFTGNTSKTSGGAIFNTGTLHMKSTTFSENSAGSVAGAINCETGIMTADSCKFISNTSVGAGGAVQIANASDAAFTVSEGDTGTFQRNTAGTWKEVTDESTGTVTLEVDKVGTGGAIRTNNSLLSVTGYTFDGNSATSTGGAVDIGSGAATSADGTETETEVEIIKFSDAKFINNKAESAGGAICNGIVDGAAGRNMTIDDCVFGDSGTNGNSAKGIGGAIHQRGKELSVSNTSFCGNQSSSNGGAIYGALSAKITLNGTDASKSVFQENKAEGTWGGGAIDIGSGTLEVTGYKFKENEAVNSVGGAIGLHTASIVTTITNSVFESNEAAENGGAISNQSTKTGVDTLTITNSTFGGENVGNKSTGGNGGAIYINTKGSVNITGTDDAAIFQGNSAQADEKLGGAIYLNAGKLTVNNYTFTGNNATYRGGAIYIPSGVEVSLTSATFNSNSSNEGGAISCVGGTMAAENCNFSSNTSTTNGGAVQVIDQSNATFSGTTGTFQSNQAGTKTTDESTGETTVTSEGAGGAIQTENSLMSVTGYTFDGNSATTRGGAVDIGSGDTTSADGTTTEANDEVITFSGTIFKNNSAEASGGAIQNGPTNASGRNMTISGCKFGESAETGNNAGDLGGAIYHRAKALNISTTSFTGNSSASNGGAIYNAGGGKLYLNGTKADSEIFQGNTAEGAYGGGAIDIGTGTLTVEGYTFKENKATSTTTTAGGGAIGIHPENITATITNSVFEGNEAQQNGGAILNQSGKTLTISGCTFGGEDKGNKTTTGNGGAIYTGRGTVDVTGTEFASNEAPNGGAIFVSGSTVKSTAYVGTLKVSSSCIFTGNKAATSGGAIYLDASVVTDGSGTSATLENSIFTKNTASGGASGNGGGAIYSASVTITDGEYGLSVEDCMFGAEDDTDYSEANTATKNGSAYGGAILVATGNAKITNSNFYYNKAGNGGAIGTQAANIITITSNNSSSFKGNCTITTGSYGRQGGAIRFNGVSVGTISGYTFDSNSAIGNGGAIEIEHDSAIEISGSTFIRNHSDVNGGAIMTWSKMSVSGCTFGGEGTEDDPYLYGNSAAKGGAIYYDYKQGEKTLTFNTCDFIGNEATTWGGACCFIGDDYQASFTGGTFKSNRSTSDVGGALVISSSKTSDVTIKNYTFTDNTSAKQAKTLYVGKATLLLDTCTVDQTKADFFDTDVMPSTVTLTDTTFPEEATE